MKRTKVVTKNSGFRRTKKASSEFPCYLGTRLHHGSWLIIKVTAKRTEVFNGVRQKLYTGRVRLDQSNMRPVGYFSHNWGGDTFIRKFNAQQVKNMQS